MSTVKVAVIGAGTMGSGIAHVLAKHGREVTLVDVSDELLQKSVDGIRKRLERQLESGQIQKEELDDTLGRIVTRTRYDGHIESAELIIEAVTEKKEAKAELFRGISEKATSEAVLATNTSSISITWLASQVERPERFVGMHFFNPVPVMKLVEIVRGMHTSEETVNAVRDLAREIDKTPVIVEDYPGFVSNRVLMPMINEAIFCLMEGVASREDIDTVMKLGMAHPMGPLALADLIGLDVCLQILDVLHTEIGDDKYRACPLLRKMVDAGQLGRKTGLGFYSY